MFFTLFSREWCWSHKCRSQCSRSEEAKNSVNTELVLPFKGKVHCQGIWLLPNGCLHCACAWAAYNSMESGELHALQVPVPLLPAGWSSYHWSQLPRDQFRVSWKNSPEHQLSVEMKIWMVISLNCYCLLLGRKGISDLIVLYKVTYCKLYPSFLSFQLLDCLFICNSLRR